MKSISLTIMMALKAAIKRLPFSDKMYSLLSEEDMNTYSTDLNDQPISPCPVEEVIPVEFPPRYWDGGPHMLAHGHPWLTPGAVLFLVNHLRRSFAVLEIGAGGSTVFFARRCRSVVSIESDETWRKIVTEDLARRQLNNVQILFKTDQGATEEFVRGRQEEEFDCILVDPKTGYDRGRLARLCRSKLKPGGVLVIDNFAVVDTEVHLETKKLGWHSHYYVDPHWSGRGTSIHIKPRAPEPTSGV